MDRVITVEHKEEKLDKNGKTYFLITDTQGQKWSVFADNDRIHFLMGAGVKVSFQTEQKGEYENIIKGTVKHLGYMAPAIKKFTPDEMKTRSACLAYSKDLVVANFLHIDDIITKAAEFYKWCSEEKNG